MRPVHLLICGVLAVISALSRPALAESLDVRYDRRQGTVTIEARDADSRRVIHDLFARTGGAAYMMDPDVSGRVTLKIAGVSPESALRTVLTRIDADYRVTGGTYRIFRRGAAGERRPVSPDLRHEGDLVINVDASRHPRDEDVPLPMRKPVDIRAVNSLIGGVFRSLTNQTGVEIKVDRDVPGELRVDIVSKGDTLWQTVRRLAIASHLKVEIAGPRTLMIRPLADFSVWYRGRNVGHVGEEYGHCAKCRYERKRDWKYCPMCGVRLH